MLEAENLGKILRLKESRLYAVIASLLSRKYNIPRAIVYGITALQISNDPFEMSDLIEIEGTLGINYKNIGEYRRSEELHIAALYSAKQRHDINLIRICCHNLACTYCKLKLFDKSMHYFEIALTYCKPDEYLYVDNMLWIAYMLLEKGDTAAALEWVDKAIPLANNFKDLLILLKSVQHSQNLDNPKSVTYLENVTMPLLIKNNMYFKAIEYADILKNFFRDKKRYKEALKYTELAERYYKIILTGDA